MMGLWAAWLATEASEDLSGHSCHWRLSAIGDWSRSIPIHTTEMTPAFTEHFPPKQWAFSCAGTPVRLSCQKNMCPSTCGWFWTSNLVSHPSYDIHFQLRTTESSCRGLGGSFRAWEVPLVCSPGTRSTPSVRPSIVPTGQEATCKAKLRHCTLPKASSVSLPRLPSTHPR